MSDQSGGSDCAPRGGESPPVREGDRSGLPQRSAPARDGGEARDLYAIIPAAGEGLRLGKDQRKASVFLSGEPLVVWALRAISRAPGLAGGVLVVHHNDLEMAAGKWLPAGTTDPSIWRVVEGGETRRQSVAAGLALVPEEAALVLVHDAARPLLAEEDLAAVIAAGRASGAAILASPVGDSLKRVEGESGGRIVGAGVDRAGLWAAETPQVFRAELLRRAEESAPPGGTDEASLLEALGERVTVVETLHPNLKITRSKDIVLAEGILHGA